jgi:hypothetical protein
LFAFQWHQRRLFYHWHLWQRFSIVFLYFLVGDSLNHSDKASRIISS